MTLLVNASGEQPGSRPQRLLDLAALSVAALALAAQFAGLDKLAVLASLAVIGAGLWIHRPSRHCGWIPLAVAAAVCAGVRLAWGPEPAPVSVGLQAVAYSFALVGLWRHIRRWTVWHQWVVVLDALILATGFAVLVAAVGHGCVPARLDVASVLMPLLALDCLLLAAAARLLFTPARGVTMGLCAAALGFQLLDHLWLLSGPGMGLPAAPGLWALGYAIVAVLYTRADVRRTALELNTERTRFFGRQQALALSAVLVLPAVILAGFGWSQTAIPWQTLGIGGVVSAVLITFRLTLLMEAVRARDAELDELARRDALTGAANRRRWDAALATAVDRAQREGSGFWVALIDLDNFKAYNDQHGHQAGDRLLVDAVRSWKALLRDGEVLARYGGEEFTVLLPDVGAEQAHARMTQFQRAVDGAGCSVGLAHWAPGMSPADVTHVADQSMYRAKARGGNRVELPPVLADTSTWA